MTEKCEKVLVGCGREVGEAELAHAQEVVRLCDGLSRHELASTLCEHWGWVGATGKLQRRACEKLLEKWQHEGHLRLPKRAAARQRKSIAGKAIVPTSRTKAQEPIDCPLSALRPVRWTPLLGPKSA